MNLEKKMKKQASDLKRSRVLLEESKRMLTHQTKILEVASQALHYIASKGQSMKRKEEPKIILLKKAGIPDEPKDVVPAEVVAQECIHVLRGMQMDFMAQEKELAPPEAPEEKTDEIEEVKLSDGDKIEFSRDFDILFHRCCDCGLVHEVELDWQDDITGSGQQYTSLVTTWRRLENVPTAEELTAKGHTLVKRKEAK